MSKKYCIYALIDPRDKTVFYIGKTRRNPLIRLDEHLQDFEGMSPKQERIRQIYNSNAGLPDLVVLENNIATDKSAFTREVFWIEMFSMMGARLTNASIDFNGIYFLTDYPLNNLPDESIDLNFTEKIIDVPQNKVHSLEIEPKSKMPELDDFSCEDYFKIELCKLPKPSNEKMLQDLAHKRVQNIASGKLKNHGFPVTSDEIFLLIKRIQRGDTVRQLVEFFQRSEDSILGILNRHGYEVEVKKQKGIGYIILLNKKAQLF